MAGRVIVLVAALLVAVLGAVLVFLYAERTVESARAELEPVSVLVASREIPAGVSVAAAQAEGLLDLTPRPSDALPPGYLEGIEGVEELVTSTNILPGEILVRGRLVDPAASDELQIGPQEMAVTIPLDDPNRVARFVEPGDLVAVFLTRTQVPVEEDGTAVGRTFSSTQLLLPEVRVIGVGSTTSADSQQADDVSQALVTVSVLQADAEKLILGQSLGSLYLGLLTEGADESAVTRSGGTTGDSLFQEATP